jgi:DNA-binding CsgD family transcriptional regulator
VTELWAGDYVAARDALGQAWRHRSIAAGAVPAALKAADGLLDVLTGEPKAVRARLTERLAADCESLVRGDSTVANYLLGSAALLDGADEDAARHLAIAYGAAREEGRYEPGRRYRLESDLGQAWVNTGRLEEAEALAAEQLEIGKRLGRPSLLGVGRRIEGLVLAARGELDAAAGSLRQAVAAHQMSPIPLDLARSRLALGQVLRRCRAKSEARQALEAALAGFTALGATPYAAIAEAELRWGRWSRTGATLTPAEQRVADLAATGMTNREIATRLFTSVRTVEGHLAAVFRKLEVRTRSELTVRLAERGQAVIRG